MGGKEKQSGTVGVQVPDCVEYRGEYVFRQKEKMRCAVVVAVRNG